MSRNEEQQAAFQRLQARRDAENAGKSIDQRLADHKEARRIRQKTEMILGRPASPRPGELSDDDLSLLLAEQIEEHGSEVFRQPDDLAALMQLGPDATWRDLADVSEGSARVRWDPAPVPTPRPHVIDYAFDPLTREYRRKVPAE